MIGLNYKSRYYRWKLEWFEDCDFFKRTWFVYWGRSTKK